MILSISSIDQDVRHVRFLGGPHCYNELETKCIKVPKDIEETECDLILDITYVEECDHKVITRCEEESTKIVKDKKDTHDSDHNTKCYNTKEKDCIRIPKEDVHEECKNFVRTVYEEECHEVEKPRCDCGFLPLDVCYRNIERQMLNVFSPMLVNKNKVGLIRCEII